jgi:LysR family cyn operon transcriptional activator
VAFRDFRLEPQVLLSPAFCARRLLDDGFQAAGLAPMGAVELNSIEAILATVLKGVLVRILPRLSLRHKQTAWLKPVTLTNPTPREKSGYSGARAVIGATPHGS